MVPLVVLPMVVVVGVGVDKWCPVPWTWEVRERGGVCKCKLMINYLYFDF